MWTFSISLRPIDERANVQGVGWPNMDVFRSSINLTLFAMLLFLWLRCSLVKEVFTNPLFLQQATTATMNLAYNLLNEVFSLAIF